MIGHFLVTLTKAQEDRVLTNPMVPGRTVSWHGGERCLVGVLEDWQHMWTKPLDPSPYLEYCRESFAPSDRLVAVRFDALCDRFGTVRMNAAIRNRILSNQARYTLRHATQLEAV